MSTAGGSAIASGLATDDAASLNKDPKLIKRKKLMDPESIRLREQKQKENLMLRESDNYYNAQSTLSEFIGGARAKDADESQFKI